MKLAVWLKREGWTNSHLAQQLGVTEEAARLYRAALRRPQEHIMLQLEKLTAGEVRKADMQKSYSHRRKQQENGSVDTIPYLTPVSSNPGRVRTAVGGDPGSAGNGKQR